MQTLSGKNVHQAFWWECSSWTTVTHYEFEQPEVLFCKISWGIVKYQGSGWLTFDNPAKAPSSHNSWTTHLNFLAWGSLEWNFSLTKFKSQKYFIKTRALKKTFIKQEKETVFLCFHTHAHTNTEFWISSSICSLTPHLSPEAAILPRGTMWHHQPNMYSIALETKLSSFLGVCLSATTWKRPIG